MLLRQDPNLSILMERLKAPIDLQTPPIDLLSLFRAPQDIQQPQAYRLLEQVPHPSVASRYTLVDTAPPVQLTQPITLKTPAATSPQEKPNFLSNLWKTITGIFASDKKEKEEELTPEQKWKKYMTAAALAQGPDWDRLFPPPPRIELTDIGGPQVSFDRSNLLQLLSLLMR